MATKRKQTPAKSKRGRKPIARKAEGKRAAGYRLVAPDGKRVSVPAHMQRALRAIAAASASGRKVTVVPNEVDLTTQQAAELLNVSRQYVVRLVDEGKLPAAKTGTHRRLRLADVLAYKSVRDAERRDALNEIARIGQEQRVGGYYDDWEPRKKSG